MPYGLAGFWAGYMHTTCDVRMVQDTRCMSLLVFFFFFCGGCVDGLAAFWATTIALYVTIVVEATINGVYLDSGFVCKRW